MLSLIVALLITISPLRATLIPTLDLVSLTSHADIIAIGEVTSIQDHGSTTLDLGGGPLQATHFVAELRLNQIIKGDRPSETVTLDFVVPHMPVGVQGVKVGQYGLFFLTKDQNDQNLLRFTDPIYPSLPAPRTVKLPSASALDQITTLFGQVLESEDVSDSDRSRALNALGGLRTDLARDILHRCLTTISSRSARLDVARTLVARNDIFGLGMVEDALLNPSGLSETMFSDLAGSLGGLKDPKAIPALKRLLETSDERIIKGGAIALRQSGSADALQLLSRLLDNGDERVRYYAVVGMGEITKQDEWTPAFPEFREHEGKYLAYWRDWAQSNLPRQP